MFVAHGNLCRSRSYQEWHVGFAPLERGLFVIRRSTNIRSAGARLFVVSPFYKYSALSEKTARGTYFQIGS